jgi:hypothetical protein
LELARQHLAPARVDVIANQRPLAEAIRQQLALHHEADQVVYVDADCLILEDLTPFLEANRKPYVDCFVTDRFRGRIHCGVHITHRDLVEAMKQNVPSKEDVANVLRPESRRRNLAMRHLDGRKEFRNFNILHDHFQYYRDIFAKYALRELRSRNQAYRPYLEAKLAAWKEQGKDDLEQFVAALGIEHAQRSLPPDAGAERIREYLDALPTLARRELRAMGIREKRPLRREELEQWQDQHAPASYGMDRPKIFGLGLSRTGTRSLTMALHTLGWDTVHYPADEDTFRELSRGDYNLTVLGHYHGITDITVAPFYPQLDRLFPGSKFILTVRDHESWLRSAANHWEGRSAFQEPNSARGETYMNVRRLLRAAVFGCYEFNAARFRDVYDLHVRNVLEYFRERPEDLLVLNICGGEGWPELCRFLEQPEPMQAFPHKGRRLSARKRRAQIGTSAA